MRLLWCFLPGLCRVNGNISFFGWGIEKAVVWKVLCQSDSAMFLKNKNCFVFIAFFFEVFWSMVKGMSCQLPWFKQQFKSFNSILSKIDIHKRQMRMWEEWCVFWCYDSVFDERWEWMKMDVIVMNDDEMKKTRVIVDGNDDWCCDVLWNEMSVWMNMFVIENAFCVFPENQFT